MDVLTHAPGDPATVELVVTGELDASTAPRVRAVLEQALIDGPAHLRVDLSAVEFIDSAGLGTLVGIHRRARVLRSRLTLVRPHPHVLRLLRITALDRVVDVEA